MFRPQGAALEGSGSPALIGELSPFREKAAFRWFLAGACLVEKFGSWA
jgi:hypothetical protein